MRSGRSPGAGWINRRAAIGALAGLAATGSAVRSRATPRPSSPGARGPDLSRGVNLSHWFAQSHNGYGADHLARFVTSADIARVAAAGFTHVRLGVEPDALFATSGKPALNEAVMTRLLDALTMIGSRNLSVVLDMHPVGASKDRYLTDEGAGRLIDNWRLLAQRLTPVAHGQLALELLNEPEPLRDDAWWKLQERIMSAIRGVDPLRWLVVNGGGWSGVDELASRQPYAQDRLIYTFHHYAPLLFTHQGADWTWDVAGRTRDLTWPVATTAAEQASAAAAPSDRPVLQDQIARGQFTEAFMLDAFARLATWSQRHGRPPIYVGEFGVYLKAPREARLRWLSASCAAFARYGWGWTHWDNSAAFGLVSPDNRAFDDATLRALGGTPG